jgi:hypothetical protein
VGDDVALTRVRTVAGLAASLLLAGCALLAPSEVSTTFSQDGYEVTCNWDQPAIGEPEPGLDVEAQSFCAARAREAVNTLQPHIPGATVESVTVGTDGAAYVCHASERGGQQTCENVLPALQEG